MKLSQKVCVACGEVYQPSGPAQKRCPACQAKAAEKPVKEPTKAQVAERNSRQRETIKRLQEQIGRLKAQILAPQKMILAENDKLKRAIEMQRMLVGDEQRAAAAMGQRNLALRRAITAAIDALTAALEEDRR